MRSAAISTAAGAHEAADDSLRERAPPKLSFPTRTQSEWMSLATAGQWNLRAAHAPDSGENTELVALII
jgi:hypothetical protein